MGSLSQYATKVVADRKENSISTIRKLLEIKKEEIVSFGVEFERFKSTLIRLFANSDLNECSPMSVVDAAMKVASLNLDLDPTLAQAYVIARYNNKEKCKIATFMIGYQGLLELARRSGDVKKIETHIVWENERYQYYVGENGTVIEHYPLRPSKRGKERIAVYVLAYLVNGEIYKEWVWDEEVIEIKNMSLSSIKPDKQRYSPWAANVISEDGMWKKTAIRRCMKYLPKSKELIKFLEEEDNYNSDNSTLIDVNIENNENKPNVQNTVVKPQTVERQQVQNTVVKPQTVERQQVQNTVVKPQTVE
ncbi:hypothetical protein CP985_14990, partial [Malaciobacter mytili LMG 24559]